MLLPRPRGPLSSLVRDRLSGAPDGAAAGPVPEGTGTAVLHDEDLQLTLWMCYELSYRGFDEVDPWWEDAPFVAQVRRGLERRWEAGLRELVPVVALEPESVPRALARLVRADDGPPLAQFLQRQASEGQFREFVTQRSIYHLKEADPHSWAIPRLSGPAKAALVEIQADEYGQGRFERMHSELFRDTMRALGLDDGYGHYVDRVPAITLAVSNLMSLFGLHRRWLGATLGHLAAFEMTSSLPNRRYGNGLRRLGGDADATRFFDVHIEADAVHEQIAAHDLCGTFARENPSAAADVLFGAACGLAVEAEFGRMLLGEWARGRSSLRPDRPTRTAGSDSGELALSG
ncbi:iron-containing redox enzyme family protein [Amycolatopsis sp. PS_44_ISF1]|uniref:iron-containing redox enzyme family protein n=1 Tax=Amycolatopsis sp. PS_44_ISF1 TaxID=2974917 RepID=UPI0028DE2B14|nr:iron-containing redox enzyme family protein [Amycolatopsis sp. PS_44_ISF1]MDT8915215.1 iron-containing redox enzyme family protein [Amycolatopsis sp. PS_44_ISF1]